MDQSNSSAPPKAGAATAPTQDAPPPSTAGPALPPAMAAARSHTVDELAAMINRVPLFMRTLDDTDGAGGPNLALEAIRSLAYEGTRAEVAGNFREQGNERARDRRWGVARGFYDKALEALRGPRQSGAEVDLVELDEDEEHGKERAIEEACYVNRALCNLELRERLSIAGSGSCCAERRTQITTAPASMTARACLR
jgi:hypothetical protein